MKLSLRILFLFLLASQICSAQWVQTGPSGGSVRNLTVSGNIVYAAMNGGALESNDNGIDWSHSNWGLIDGDVNAIVATSNKVYAGTQDHGVYMKDPNGLIWAQTPMMNQRVTAMATIGTNVFAGTYSTGVWLSTDDGSSWAQVNNGLTSLQVECFAVIGTNLFAGTGNKLFLSTNMGANWTSASTGITGTEVMSLGVNGTALYAGVWANGVWVSTNNGTGWMKFGTGSPASHPQSFAFNGSTVYVAEGSVYRTTNNGDNWTNINGDIPINLQIQSLAYINGNLIAGDNTVNRALGLYVTTNEGTNWTTIKWGLPNYCANSVAARNGRLLAGTCGGVWLSTNAGSNWIAPTVHGQYDWADFTALAFRNNSTLFAGDINGNAYVSTDAGQSFTYITKVEQGALISSFAFSGTNIFASTNAWASGSENAVFLSGDNGATWTKVNTGIPTTSYIPSLAIIGTNLFAAAGTGVYLSTNDGTSWTAVSDGLTGPYVHCLAVKGTDLYLGTSGGVFRSTNNGTNWIATSLTEDTKTLFVADTILFAGGASTHYMVNSDLTWISSGLPNGAITGFAADNGILYASTLFHTVWKRPIAEILTGVKDGKQVPVEFYLSQNYPNPFNPSTTIEYNIPFESKVDLTIYNTLGQVVNELISGVQSQGTHQIKFNGAALSSGIYYYKINAASMDGKKNFSSTKKMILLK